MNITNIKLLILFSAFFTILSASPKSFDIPLYENSISNITLDDPAWETNGIKFTKFYSVYPELDTNPSYSPTIYLLFDGNNIGIKFFCPKKEKTISTSTTRDFNMFGQDGFSVLLDTYNNKRSAYLFGINSNNIQSDCYGDNAAESQDPSWDAEWYSETRELSDGWEGKIIIPIKDLRFNNGKWGINFLEAIKRIKGTPKVEVISWTPPRTALIDPSTFGEINIPLKKESANKTFKIIPYFASFYEPVIYKAKAGIDLGGTFKNNYSINLTYNPDFAQIEGDIDQINLSKTNLWLQEKRPFFMEKGDILSSLLTLMYTRSIDTIKYGGKITGNLNGMDIYSFYVFEKSDTSNNIFCLRTKNNFGDNWVGFYETSKLKDNFFNHSIGIDGKLKLLFQSDLNYAVAATYTKGLPNKNNFAYVFEIRRSTINKGLMYNFSYKEFQENYNPEVGFVSLPQIRSGNGSLSYIFPINYFGIQSISPSLSYSNWRNINDNSLILESYQPSIGINFKRIFNLGYSIKKYTRLINNQYFNNLTNNLNVNIVPSGKFNMSVFYIFGKYYNSNLYYPGVSVSTTPRDNLSMAFSLDYFFVNNDDHKEKTLISSVIINWNITKKLTYRTFLQWSDESNELQYNSLISYDFFVGSHIYLAWNEVRDISNFNFQNKNLPLTDRTLYLKICYTFKI